MPLLSLGNIQLDQVLGGGIEEDRCTMLVGDPGSGLQLGVRVRGTKECTHPGLGFRV